ncbi:MAG: PLP-dependent aminotransferase family protein [Candidatus Gastranaerophilales bacterium]|nr:PLP-dependent aminotransferase family protein [Candidatus Gastranaerophilales bacterium]
MYDMTIQLDTGGGKCLYQQIYEHIRQEIKEGKLLAGERLPSTRSLAEYLQVSRSTVDYAYDQLLSEGYVESRPYKGYFVCSLENILDIEGEGTVERPRTASERENEAAPHAANPYQYDFSPNGIDMSGFPFGVWKRITKNILNDGNSELFSQGEPQGDYDLRLTISRYLHSSRGVNCAPEQIVVGAGHDYLLMLLEKLLGRDACIVMENATYKKAYRIFQSFGYEIATVDADANGMSTPKHLEREADAAYLMPAHQFPTGVVMSVGRRTEFLRWAGQVKGRYLIEDDYDSEFRYRGKPIPALQSLDEHGKVIYMGTFSKAVAPAIRVGYMVLPQELWERYLDNGRLYSCTVSRIDQRILNEFIRDGYFERHLNKMRKRYRAKHDLLLECLKPFLKCFDISGEDAGLHLVLRSKDQKSEAELLGAAAHRQVKVYGLSDYMVTPSAGQGTVLLGFGGLDDREIETGVELLKGAWL